jgi:Fic family protein
MAEDQFMLANLIVEIILGEDARIRYDDIFDIVVNIVEGKMFYPSDKLCKKVINVYNAVLWLGSSSDILTIEKIIQLHRIVGNDIIHNAGIFRLQEAKPAGYEFYYLPASRILIEMNSLLSWFNNQIANVNIDMLVEFYIRFLYFHPFSNGNGRIARILMYWLIDLYLVDYSFVSLYLDIECNMDRMQKELVEAQQYGNYNGMIQYVKACIARNKNMLIYLKK